MVPSETVTSAPRDSRQPRNARHERRALLARERVESNDMRGKVVGVWLALAMCLLVAACYTGPDAKHFIGVLDEFRAPPGWRLVATKISGPGGQDDFECSPVTDGGCPSAIRYYFVDSGPRIALDAAEKMIVDAGFALGDEVLKACDGAPSGPVCSFFANRDADRISVSIFRSARDAGLAGEQADGMIIVIAAKR